MKAPNLTFLNCNPLLPAVKNTLGQFQFLPPAPHFQLCLENTGQNPAQGTSPILLSVLRQTGCSWWYQRWVGSSVVRGASQYPKLQYFYVHTECSPLHTPSRDFISPWAQKTDEGAVNGGISWGQLAELWVASRHCWGITEQALP